MTKGNVNKKMIKKKPKKTTKEKKQAKRDKKNSVEQNVIGQKNLQILNRKTKKNP